MRSREGRSLLLIANCKCPVKFSKSYTIMNTLPVVKDSRVKIN